MTAWVQPTDSGSWEIVFFFIRMFYQDALNALFVFGVVYASIVVGMTLTQVLILGLILGSESCQQLCSHKLHQKQIKHSMHLDKTF